MGPTRSFVGTRNTTPLHVGISPTNSRAPIHRSANPRCTKIVSIFATCRRVTTSCSFWSWGHGTATNWCRARIVTHFPTSVESFSTKVGAVMFTKRWGVNRTVSRTVTVTLTGLTLAVTTDYLGVGTGTVGFGSGTSSPILAATKTWRITVK